MSFRLRVLVMVVFVVLTATAATAWLSLNQATDSLRESQAADQAEVTAVVGELRGFGTTRGGWDGIADLVRSLAGRTGERIRVEDDLGTPLADSDLLTGHTARPVGGPAVLVDPRAVLRLPENQDPTVLPRLTIFALSRYRSAIAYARCLARAGAGVTVGADNDGVPVITPATDQQTTCASTSPATDDVRGDSAAAMGCATAPAARLVPCLQQVFARRSDEFAPARLQVYLGAVNESSAGLPVTPIAAVALAVAVVAILGALLLSRAVLRPVRALTGAARRLGAGDLDQRVPVAGRDEIADLGRSFNAMADAVQASEQRQRRLVADIAHELRTPLANVRAYVEAMRDGVVEPDAGELDSVLEEVLLQQRIVADLQDLTLAESGTLTYHRVSVDVAELLTTCRSAHRALAESASVSLTTAADSARIHGDPDRLRQALGNLIVNAVRATPPGGEVRLTAKRDGDFVRIAVADTGAGIAAPDLPHLFERFWRADPARGRATGGSGLGLTIAKQIIDDHGGRIEVTSGAGTTFTIILRAEKQAQGN